MISNELIIYVLFEILEGKQKRILKCEKEIKKLNKQKENVKSYIINNFSNEDGSVWHSDMREILDILYIKK